MEGFRLLFFRVKFNLTDLIISIAVSRYARRTAFDFQRVQVIGSRPVAKYDCYLPANPMSES
jgi:hypothetical protein